MFLQLPVLAIRTGQSFMDCLCFIEGGIRQTGKENFVIFIEGLLGNKMAYKKFKFKNIVSRDG